MDQQTTVSPSKPPEGSLARVARVTAASVLAVGLAAACSGENSEPSNPEPSATTRNANGGSELQIGEDGLPVDFPSDEVPVLDGDVISVSAPGRGSDGYTVLIGIEDLDQTQAVSQAVQDLEGAGWDAVTTVEGQPPVPQVLTMDGGRVIVTNGVQREQTTLTYVVDVPS